MYFTRDPKPFIDYIARFASLPVCQGTRRVENATWYGDQDASLLICPACFEEAVRGTYFASTLPLQNKPLPAANHCSLYSARMRGMYAQACETRSLTSLLAFAARREEVYRETIPQIENFLANQRQKEQLLRIAGTNRANAIASQALYNGFTGRNAIVHGFSQGVVGLTLGYEQQRRDLVYDARRPGMVQLEQRWKEVE